MVRTLLPARARFRAGVGMLCDAALRVAVRGHPRRNTSPTRHFISRSGPYSTLGVQRVQRWLSVVLGSCALFGCSQLYYSNTKTGTLDGILRVEWIGENSFIYEPDERAPLTFTTSAGRKVSPQRMYTDGGSIPPVFWGVPGLSPWGYAPGYMVHDWLFEMHHCQYAGYETISFQDSAQILSETIKTLMVQNKVPMNPDALYAIHEGVSSSIAEEIWKNGQCKPIPAAVLAAPRRMWGLPGAPASRPIVVLELDFRSK